ncbi:MAG: CoB--CoM heterodisulfide reductase iron-sulfur subunit A family protein [Deltaproteobacteria bacterium]|nr:CoB--CoM heterodisulfide reductase iron-sulfur subunit A family protein [Deltaproteobacteria bacterium]
MSTVRIGVFICECGPNIKNAVDLDGLSRFARGLDNVVVAERFALLCSLEGKDTLAKEIQRHRLTRVVIAACSPKEHEHTFKQVMAQAGLNSFLLQIANIREQCAWVISDKTRATQKAQAILEAAVNRVARHEPLEIREIACLPDVVVVGAGMAGISAALTLAQKDRKVHLVEKAPCIGGKVARYEDLFPNLECASCVLDPLLDAVLHHPNIQLWTLSEVKNVLGYFGNYTVEIITKARHVDLQTCIGCGACVEVCPVSVQNEYNEGLDTRKAVYLPYPGALPNLAAIDETHCLRWQSQDCESCQQACPFGSIDYQETDRNMSLKAGAVVIATGFDLFDVTKAPQYGYGKIDNIYTALEFERLVNANGPTQGKLILKDGRVPESIVLIHCVGSRTPRYHQHCSGVCCSYLFKFAHQIRKKIPDATITSLYTDMCLPGKEAQPFSDKIAQKTGLKKIRIKDPAAVTITQDHGRPRVTYTDACDASKSVVADMVVLAPAITGTKDASSLGTLFDIPLGGSGFFVEEQTSLAPVSTPIEGVFVAGCAQGPKEIQAAVSQGQAAAGKILSQLVPGQKRALEAMTAAVDTELCSGCKICLGLCPYKAIVFDDTQQVAGIEEVLCRGCGICAATCPSGAISARHFTDAQLGAEIESLARHTGRENRS